MLGSSHLFQIFIVFKNRQLDPRLTLTFQRPSSSLEQAHSALCTRLLQRRSEIKRTVLSRVTVAPDPTGPVDPEYLLGLRTAVSAAVDYGLATLKVSGGVPPPIPVDLLAQARIAAHNEIDLGTVLRRYFAGYSIFGDFLSEEAGVDERLQGVALRRLTNAQAAQFDRLVALVSEEHSRETKRHTAFDTRPIQRIRGLLAEEPLDTSELSYDFEGHHVGAVARGPGAQEAVQSLAKAIDSRVLVVRPALETIWAWLGTRSKIDPSQIKCLTASEWPAAIHLGLGEATTGLSGWRLTHRQAKAAFSVALAGRRGIARYADVALLASMTQDELLMTSMRELYLAPLADARDGGLTLRETLRAYFATNRNSSSTAAALGVTRQTVTNRLRAVEERIGRPLNGCAADLEAALRLADVDLIG